MAKMQPLDKYSYSLEKFKGPIGLLLYLVRQQEVDVRDIPISALANQYRQRDDADVDEGAEFLLNASSLLWLKSCALVPSESRQSAIPDADFDSLVQIAEYCELRKAAQELGQREEGSERHFPRGLSEPITQPDPLELSADELALMLDDLLKRAKPGRIYDEEYRVEDALTSLQARLHEGDLPFGELFSLEKPRGELIVNFLAVLELMKRQELRIFRRNEEVVLVYGCD